MRRIKFYNGRNGVIARVVEPGSRGLGRVAFPARGKWPAGSPRAGEIWDVRLVGENSRQTVFFVAPVRQVTKHLLQVEALAEALESWWHNEGRFRPDGSPRTVRGEGTPGAKSDYALVAYWKDVFLPVAERFHDRFDYVLWPTPSPRDKQAWDELVAAADELALRLEKEVREGLRSYEDRS